MPSSEPAEPSDSAIAADGSDRAAVFQVLPTPYVVLTPELVVVDANDAYLAVTGRSRAELIGVKFLQAFPPPPESFDASGRSELQVSLERVRDTGRPDTLPVQKYPIAGSDGVMHERHWVAVHVPVLDADGRVRLLVQRTEDITEYSLEREKVAALLERVDADGELIGESVDARLRARAERVEADLFVRARELADAVAAKDAYARQIGRTAEVSIALTSAGTLEALEKIVVGRGVAVLGADGGAVVSRTTDGQWRISAPALGARVQEIYGTVPYDSPLPGPTTARVGQRMLLADRAAGLAFDPSMARVYENTARNGWGFFPLLIGDQHLGALVVCWIGEHELSQQEIELLDGFAAQCALALLRIETVALEQAAAMEVLQLAESLQQALLTPPPHVDGCEIAVRYRPAGHHAQVGGDWYDAFALPNGDTMLVIGDVVGHDRIAAAKMGQLRGVLRTLAYDAVDRGDLQGAPAAVLSRLEHAARGLAVDTFATTVVARVERLSSSEAHWQLRWSNAGHPPPVLLHADGRVDFLDTKADLMLGVDPDADRHDHTVVLPAGSTLILFTDGLIERRRASEEISMEALAAALRDLATTRVDDLCDALLARLAPDAGDDDIALLTLRIVGGP